MKPFFATSPDAQGPFGPKGKLYALAGGAGLLALAAILYFATRGGSPEPAPAQAAAAEKTAEAEPADPPLRLPPQPPPRQKPPVPAKEPPVKLPADPVLARGAFAREVFEDLRRRGIHIAAVGGEDTLLVPPALRFTPVPSSKFVEEVAAFSLLKVVWLRGGKAGLLYRRTEEPRVARFLIDIFSIDPAVRAQAAWRARWMQDPRIVPPLLAAAQDKNHEVVQQARASLRRFGWMAAVATEPAAALPALKMELSVQDDAVRGPAVSALALLDAIIALPLVNAQLANCKGSRTVPLLAAEVLATLNTPEAFTKLVELASSNDPAMVSGCARAIWILNDERARNLVTLMSNNTSVTSEGGVAYGLGRCCNPTTDLNLKKALGNGFPYCRAEALRGLAQQGLPETLGVFENMLNRKEHDDAVAVASNLGLFGKQAWPLMERLLADPQVHFVPTRNRGGSPLEPTAYLIALQTLGHLADDKALAILSKAVKDRQLRIVQYAAGGLSRFGDQRARESLLSALEDGSPGRAETIVQALADPPYPSGFQILRKIHQQCSGTEKNNALRAMAATDPTQAFPFVHSALASEDLELRRAAAMALRDLNGEDTVPLVGPLLKDKDPAVANFAMMALAEFGGDAALETIQTLHKDPAAPFTHAELAVLQKAGGKRALPLLALALKTTDDDLAAAAASALAATMHSLSPTDRPAAWPLVAEAARLPSLRAHYVACAMVDAYGGEAQLPILEAVLADVTGDRRLAHQPAVDALEKIGGAKAQALIVKEMDCSDTMDRYLALEALAKQGTPEAKALIVGRIETETNSGMLSRMREKLRKYWPDDVEVRDALLRLEERYIQIQKGLRDRTKR